MPKRVPDQPRESYIGSSEAAALLGLDPYTSRFDLWCRKTGRKKEQDDTLLDLGLHLEPWVRHRLPKERHEVQEVVDPEPGMLMHENEVLGGHDDGDWIPTPHLQRQFEKATLEIKTVGGMVYRQIQAEGLSSGNVIQLNTMAGLKGDSHGGFAVFNRDSGRDTLFFQMPVAEDLYQRVVEEAERFRVEHIEADIPPDLFPKDPLPPVPHLAGDSVVLDQDEDWLVLMEEYGDYKALSDELDRIWKGSGIPDDYEGEPTEAMLGLKRRIQAAVEATGVEQVIGGGFKVIHRPDATQSRVSGKEITAVGPLNPDRTYEVLMDAVEAAVQAGKPVSEEWMHLTWEHVLQSCRMVADDFRREQRWAYFRILDQKD